MSRRSILKLVTGSYDDNEPDPEEEREVSSAMNQKQDNREEWMESEGQLTIDVYQLDDEMIIKSTIAGVSQEDLDVTITNDMVTIRGERERDEEVDAEDYYYQELYWGPFSRTIILPQEIDTDGAQATLKDGILTIRLPKLERSKSKRLKIS